MVNSHSIDTFDSWRMGEADVGDQLLCFDGGDDADEKEELREGSVQPDDGDEAGDYDGAHGVDPPFEFGTADRGEDTEAVNQEIVSVVLPQDVNLRIPDDLSQQLASRQRIEDSLVLNTPAVEEKGQFGCEGDRYCDDGW